MKNRLLRARSIGAVGLALFGAALVFSVSGAGASGSLVAYNAYPLVSDAPPAAPLGDASLVNGWGLSASAASPWWSANNKSDTATLYTGVGSKNPTVVNIPGG